MKLIKHIKLKAHSLWYDNQCQNKHTKFVVVDIRFVYVVQSVTTKIRFFLIIVKNLLFFC